MDYKRFISKRIKLTQKDGFTRQGIVKAVEDDYLVIVMDNGKLQFVNVGFIGVIRLEDEE